MNTETVKQIKLMTSIFGTSAGAAMLANQPGINMPEDFNTLPEEEQARRLKLALEAGTEKEEANGKPLPVYNTLDEIFKDAGSHQVTGRELLNGRTHICGQWQEINLSEDLREQVISKIAETAGGHTKTKHVVYGVLRYGKPQHWALDRFLLSKYGDSPARLSYCAGQDMTWEMRDLRNNLKK